MNMKISKLNYQVNSEKTKPIEKVSEIFKGFSVFVNGFTDPPALVIRDLMIAHGGEYHCYYMHRKTSFVIATSIANAKIDRIREKEIFIRADWITESISAGRALPYNQFLIYEKGANEKARIENFFTKTTSSTNEKCGSQSEIGGFLDARNPHFIKDYYARSRLHLISTLAQDMKDFVANLRQNSEKSTKKMRKGNLVFHIDLDCFFVSVALRTRSELINEPVAISHRANSGASSGASSMSEIASCSYPARKCGVKNGMLVKNALKMCPRLVLLPYQFDDYIEVSKRIYEILAGFSMNLRAVSCDEMYLSCPDEKNQEAVEFAEEIRRIIREETGCTASVGIGPTSLIARLATRHAKPDGVHMVTASQVSSFIASEKIKNLPGIGYQMMDKLGENLETCMELQTKSERELAGIFGPKQSAKIWRQCRGLEEDSEEFWEVQIRKSVSCDINYGIRFGKREDLNQLLKAISEEIESKLIQCQMMAGSVTLKLMIRSPNAPIETAKFMGHGHCDTQTKTINLTTSTCRATQILQETMKLSRIILASTKIEDLRGVGVTCAKLKSRTRKDAVEAVKEMFKKKSDVRNVEENEKIEKSVQGSFGFFNLTVIEIGKMERRQKLKGLDWLSMIKCAPTETTVIRIHRYFLFLLKSGRFTELRQQFQKFLDYSADLKKSHKSWFFASNAIQQRIKEESKEFFGIYVDFLTKNEEALMREKMEKKDEEKLQKMKKNWKLVEIIVEESNTKLNKS
ncbi:unnamed protein product [Caenorhabditis angaria]|uniref:DNA repair protein REV1 n=1 Tax=Caenorhabditis angaria TaxID=860376 RepID=A0A9P1MX42_9PELO|nr:unnamed protein product [Caenorhabditis angaria]